MTNSNGNMNNTKKQMINWEFNCSCQASHCVHSELCILPEQCRLHRSIVIAGLRWISHSPQRIIPANLILKWWCSTVSLYSNILFTLHIHKFHVVSTKNYLGATCEIRLSSVCVVRMCARCSSAPYSYTEPKHFTHTIHIQTMHRMNSFFFVDGLLVIRSICICACCVCVLARCCCFHAQRKRSNCRLAIWFSMLGFSVSSSLGDTPRKSQKVPAVDVFVFSLSLSFYSSLWLWFVLLQLYILRCSVRIVCS